MIKYSLFIFVACFSIGSSWTYEAEDDVQACRDLLSANLVTVYADGERYILTNVLTGAYMASEQPTYLRGTRTQKLSKEALLRMALDLEKVAVERSDNYAGPISMTAPIEDVGIYQTYGIAFIFVSIVAAVALCLCYQCIRR